MVVNFRARVISRGARKLALTPTIIKKYIYIYIYISYEMINSHAPLSKYNITW
jgi:hypothetical protein